MVKKANTDRINSIKPSIFNSHSLFSAAASKSSKLKSNLITINFAESNLYKLMQSMFSNMTITAAMHHIKLKQFRELFELKKFNKELFDYTTYHECRKQLQQTGYKASEPMCLLNLDSSLSSSSIGGSDQEYDYYDTSSVLGDDHFSVQTSFDYPLMDNKGLSTASFYLASICQKRKRPIRNSNQFGSLSKDLNFTPSAKSKYQVRLNENKPESSGNHKTLKLFDLEM